MSHCDRIGGNLFKTFPGAVENTGFGIIIGDDGHHYFFLPTWLRDPLLFRRLTPGSAVTFRPTTHPRGLRARNITVTKLLPQPEHLAVTVHHGDRP